MTSRTARADHSEPAAYSIRVVARLSGISADTLRMWERRYGFPKPTRNEKGNRLYSAEDVDRLVLISRAMQAGYRPGEVVAKRKRELEKLLADSAKAPAALVREEGDIAEILRDVAADQVASARQRLRQLALTLGPRAFVVDVAAPLVEQTGLAWAGGRIEVRHEHLLSEMLASQLRLSMAAYEDQGGSPVIVLATLPQEHHRLGLDMVAVYLASMGADVRMLGPNTPADQIARTAASQRAPVIAVSVSIHADVAASSEYVAWLAAEIGAERELWVGGAGARHLALGAHNVRLVATWDALSASVARVRTSLSS